MAAYHPTSSRDLNSSVMRGICFRQISDLYLGEKGRFDSGTHCSGEDGGIKHHQKDNYCDRGQQGGQLESFDIFGLGSLGHGELIRGTWLT